jgi:alkylation response protein AidB-like acyl-CoA dehydrogenase
MRFGPSEVARTLRDATAQVLATEVTAATLRAGWDAGAGLAAGTSDDPAAALVRGAWRKLAATGALGTLVPEDHGGLGLDEVSLVPMLEEVGRSGLPGPVAETIAVAAPALAAAARGPAPPARPGAPARWPPALGGALDRVLSAEATVTAQLSGGPLVPYGQLADLVVLRVADSLRVYERAELTLAPQLATDRSRAVARLAPPSATAGTLLADDPACLEAAWLRGVTGTAALLNGLSLRMLDTTVGYVRQREQFGVPVGSFQAIKHALANALVAVELARPAALAAAWALAASRPDAAASASVAKVLAADAARLIARTAIQCHGAIGYTTEYDLHLLAKRAWALIADWGDPDWHRGQLAAHLGIAGDAGIAGDVAMTGGQAEGTWTWEQHHE